MNLTNLNQTMTSLEIVDMINMVRKEEGNNKELRHDHFMTKVTEVLGKINAPKFLGTQVYGINNRRSIYNFPKREAMLMAMSYSYSTQARLYDRWQELEEKVANYQPSTIINNYGKSVNLIQCSDTEYKKYSSSWGYAGVELRRIKKQRKLELEKLRDYAIHELDLFNE